MSSDSSKQLFDAAADITADHFSPRKGEVFEAQFLSDPAQSFELKLVEVTRYPDRPNFKDREQFSVLFEPVGDKLLQSGTLCKILDNGAEWLILFVNPISMPSDTGPNVLYETAFC